MIQAFAYFPSIIYRDEHPEWVDYTLKTTQKYFDFQNNQGTICQTSNMGNDLNMKFLVDYLLTTSQEILISQGYAIDRYEFYLSGLWGQEIKGFIGTDIHVHKNTQLCGWFFLESPEQGSYPVYYDTRMNKEMIELDMIFNGEITNATSSIHFNNVIPGTIILANSWMKHQLTPNMSDKPTKSIHFTISQRDKLCNTC